MMGAEAAIPILDESSLASEATRGSSSSTTKDPKDFSSGNLDNSKESCERSPVGVEVIVKGTRSDATSKKIKKKFVKPKCNNILIIMKLKIWGEKLVKSKHFIF